MKLIEVIMVLMLFMLMFYVTVAFLMNVADMAVRTIRLRRQMYGIRQQRLEAAERIDAEEEPSI